MLTSSDIAAANAATAAEHAATASRWEAHFQFSGDPEDADKAEFYRLLAEQHATFFQEVAQ